MGSSGLSGEEGRAHPPEPGDKERLCPLSLAFPRAPDNKGSVPPGKAGPGLGSALEHYESCRGLWQGARFAWKTWPLSAPGCTRQWQGQIWGSLDSSVWG